MKKKVLILCTGNSCRSQMAEEFLRNLGGDNFNVVSAGIKPSQVHPLAIKVMSEVSINISQHRSKSVDEFIGQKFNYVITVCDNARQTCPIFPGQYEKIHWDVEDPAETEGSEEEKLTVFRNIRDQIKENILKFLSSKQKKN